MAKKRSAARTQESGAEMGEQPRHGVGARRRKAGRRGRASTQRARRTGAEQRGGVLAEAADMARSAGAASLLKAKQWGTGAGRIVSGAASRTGDAASTVAGQVWDNRWPALLIGAGATWLAMDALRERTPKRGRGRRNAQGTIGEAGRSVGRFVRDNPVLVGATAVGVGLAVGFSLPTTNSENRLLGEARDSMVRGAREATRGTVRNVREAAERMVGTR